MAPRIAKKGSGRTPAGKARWPVAVAGCVGIAAMAVLAAALFPSRKDDVQATTGLCPHFDIDPKTGQMRERGMIPCSGMAMQGTRIEEIRKGFSQH